MNTISSTQGDRADFPGLGSRYLLRGEATGGRFALIEHDIPPRTLAAPIHTHEREDEYSFVLEGRIGVRIGAEELEAGAGELVLKPRGIPHAFWNPGDEPARLLELISPAGFESYFEELAPHLAGPEPDFEQLAAIRDKYGLTMDMDSRGELIERHGLQG